MRKATFVIVASGFGLLFVAGAMLQSLVVLQRVAAVSGLHGDVKLKPVGADAYFPLGDTRYVKAGDILRTGDGGVTLNWVDGTRIRVGPNSQLKVLKCQFNTATSATLSQFHLDVGRVWVRVMKKLSPRSKFEVATPTATAGVRGTIFGVAVDRIGNTRVEVIEGRVAVRAGEKVVDVDRYQEAEIRAGGTLTEQNPQTASEAVALKPLSKEELEQWQRESDIMGPYLDLRDITPDKLKIVSGKVRLKGVTEIGVRLTCNGQPVELGPRGRFTVYVPIGEDGEVHVKLVATDPRGYSTTLERTIHLPSSQPAAGPAL